MNDFDGRASILGSRKSRYFLFSPLPKEAFLMPPYIWYTTHTRVRVYSHLYLDSVRYKNVYCRVNCNRLYLKTIPILHRHSSLMHSTNGIDCLGFQPKFACSFLFIAWCFNGFVKNRVQLSSSNKGARNEFFSIKKQNANWNQTHIIALQTRVCTFKTTNSHFSEVPRESRELWRTFMFITACFDSFSFFFFLHVYFRTTVAIVHFVEK